MQTEIVTASAPARIDLAGGTLDIWPLYLLHPGSVTVNAAVALRAEARVARRERGVHLRSLDLGVDEEASDADAIRAPELQLAARLVAEFAPGLALDVAVHSRVPRGSGLGGSSTLAIALAGALLRVAGLELAGERLIDVVQDVETAILRVPTGRQDYAAALYGGVSALWWKNGRCDRQAIDPGVLARHLVLVYTGEPHFSGANNWEVTRTRLDGDKNVAAMLDGIRDVSGAMAEALRQGRVDLAGAALAREWDCRKALTPRISTPQIDTLVAAALAAGAWGAKVCGAGGGGCLVALAPVERREAVAVALAQGGAQVLEAALDPRGLVVSG